MPALQQRANKTGCNVDFGSFFTSSDLDLAEVEPPVGARKGPFQYVCKKNE